MNGSDVLKGYVPEADTTIVSRILNTSGIKSGKSTLNIYTYLEEVQLYFKNQYTTWSSKDTYLEDHLQM